MNDMYPDLADLCFLCGEEHVKTTEPIAVFECVVCNTTYLKDADDSTEIMCGGCAPHYGKCEQCKDNIVDKRTHYQYLDTATNHKHNVHGLCTQCFNKTVDRCKLCRIYLKKGQGPMCPECIVNVTKCDLCNRDIRKTNAKEVDGKLLCGGCYGQRVSHCNYCEKLSIDVGQHYHHRHGEGMAGCRKCIGSPVMGYRFKPAPRFFGQGVLYYGIENEYDFPATTYKKHTDALRMLYAQDDLRYFVHDGSLNFGVEMIFNPMTFDYFSGIQELLPVEVPNSRGVTAGCHVHMSKDAFTTFHLFKFMNFLTENVKKFHPLFQREIGEISPVTGKKYCEEVPYSAKELARTRYGNRKYWWINLKNKATIEIRIFKAARKSSELQAIVQSLDALYYYTKDNTQKALTFEGYLDFMNQKQYEQACEVFGVGMFNINRNKQKKGKK
jgi:hypothetical protein